MSRNHCSAVLSFGASFRCPLPLWLLEHIRNVCRSSRCFSWKVKWSESCSVVSNSLRPHGLYSPWNSPVQNTGVGSLSLLQGIFPTQGSNTGLPHCRRILYQLSHQGSPRILEWVAYPFSIKGSNDPESVTGWGQQDSWAQLWSHIWISPVPAWPLRSWVTFKKLLNLWASVFPPAE